MGKTVMEVNDPRVTLTLNLREFYTLRNVLTSHLYDLEHKHNRVEGINGEAILVRDVLHRLEDGADKIWES